MGDLGRVLFVSTRVGQRNADDNSMDVAAVSTDKSHHRREMVARPTYIRACRHIDGYNGPNWIIQRPSPLGRSSRRLSARTSATGNSDGKIITFEFDEAVNQTIADPPHAAAAVTASGVTNTCSRDTCQAAAATGCKYLQPA